MLPHGSLAQQNVETQGMKRYSAKDHKRSDRCEPWLKLRKSESYRDVGSVFGLIIERVFWPWLACSLAAAALQVHSCLRQTASIMSTLNMLIVHFVPM